MVSTDTTSPVSSGTIVAIYPNHGAAEAAVHRLVADGVDRTSISIVGQTFETTDGVQGFYRPADAAKQGVGDGAWFGGLFGMMLGALGFFVFPVVGSILILGPLAGLVGGAVAGAGVGALAEGMVAVGVPQEEALRYRDHLHDGQFLILIHPEAGQTTLAYSILEGTHPTELQTHFAMPAENA